MKRAMDVCVSLVLIAVLAPLLIIIAVIIVMHSRGGAFFAQERVGKGGVPFRILKFRTMVANAERIGGFRTEVGDRRITRVGRVLRRTSLDELPQLLNVLKGDMSIVGPRPDVPGQRADYTEAEWISRHRVRPGITGLAQATLRSDATMDERKRLDLQYAARPSLAMDFKIVLMTLRQIVVRGGN